MVDEFPERLLIGEIYLPIERLVAYYGRDLEGVHLPFNFALLHARWNAGSIATLIELRGRVAAGRVAELGARQSRPGPHRQPGRQRPGAHRRHVCC